MSDIFLKIINRILVRFFCIRKLPVRNNENPKTIYLTFDDGPNPGITEFVIEELRKYNFTATFFCTGKAVEQYPHLIHLISENGHSIGNHSYNHFPAYAISADSYIRDVEKAAEIINSTLFRPPHGCLKLKGWKKLRHYKIIYWNLVSNDWCQESDKIKEGLTNLKKVKPGDIVLFHFSNELEKGTREILPEFLEWLNKTGFKSQKIDLK